MKRVLLVCPLISLWLFWFSGYSNAAPVNDGFAKAKVISYTSGITGVLANETNLGATTELGEPNIGGAPPLHTVWYKFSAPVGATVHVDIVDNLGLRMTFFALSSEGSLESLAAGQSTTNTQPGDIEHLAGSVSPNFPLYLAVDANTPGTFTISYRFSQTTGDFFADAIALTGASGNSYGYTSNATTEPGEPATATGDAHTVWFKWIAPTTASYTFDTIDSSFDTVLEIFSGAAINSLTRIAVSDSASGVPDNAGLISFAATAGTTYYIRLYGHTQTTGRFNLDYYLSSSPGQFSINRYYINNIGIGSTYQFSVRRLFGSAGTASVQIATSTFPGGPVANTDYTPINLTLSFAAGEIEKKLSLATFATNTPPPLNFIVNLSLSNPSPGTLLGPAGYETAVSIFLQQQPAKATPYIQVSNASITVTEGQTALIPVERVGDAGVGVSQQFQVIPAANSARQAAGVDLASTVTVQMDPGTIFSYIYVPIPEDYIFEGPEDVTVSNGNSTAATIHIMDDDPARPQAVVYESVQLSASGLGAFNSRIVLAPTGAITGQLRARVGTYSFKTTLAANGTATVYITRPGNQSELQVSLQFLQNMSKVSCHIQTPNADIVQDYTSNRALQPSDGPSAQAGKYTFYVSSMNFAGASVANPIYGTLDITSAGAVTMIAKLVGGQTASLGSQQELGGQIHGSFLAGSNEFLGVVFNPFAIAGFSDLYGTALLHKAPFTGDKLYPKGFAATSSSLQAIKYTPPSPGSYLLSAWQPSGAGKLVTANGSFSALTIPFTASTQSTVQFSSATNSPTLKPAPLTRSFTGSVTPSGHKPVPFSGIFYQGTGSYSLGIGNFISDGAPGAVTLSGP